MKMLFGHAICQNVGNVLPFLEGNSLKFMSSDILSDERICEYYQPVTTPLKFMSPKFWVRLYFVYEKINEMFRIRFIDD